MTTLTPTEYSTGKDAYLYIESIGELQSQVNGVVALCTIFFVLCWATFGARVYVRAFMLSGMAPDDWWLLATMIIFSVYAILLVIICADFDTNIAGYAAGEVPTTLAIPHMVVAGYCLYSAVTIVFKISLGYFFLKIFSNQRTWRITIWVSMVLPGLLGILNIGWTSAFPCQLMSVFFAGLPSCGDFKARTDWAVVAALWAGVSAITDLLYGVLAFRAIKSLQMPWKTRVTAALLCSLGCVGGVAACVRLAFLIASVPGLSVLGEALHTAIWSVIEPGLAIFAASVASLRPLWMKWKDSNWSPSGGSTNPRSRPARSNMVSRAPATVQSQATASRLENKGPEGAILLQVELDQVTEV